MQTHTQLGQIATENTLNSHCIVLDSLSPSESKLIYSYAYQNYQDGLYGKAEDLFRYLTLKDPQAGKHWLGLGACLQMLKQYDSALPIYQMAAAVDPQDSRAHLYAAECLIALNQQKKAQSALEYAEKLQHQFPPEKSSQNKLNQLKSVLGI